MVGCVLGPRPKLRPGQARRGDGEPDRLTMNGRKSEGCAISVCSGKSGWLEAAGNVGCRWVPALRQAQGRLCAGMTGAQRSEGREVSSEIGKSEGKGVSSEKGDCG